MDRNCYSKMRTTTTTVRGAVSMHSSCCWYGETLCRKALQHYHVLVRTTVRHLNGFTGILRVDWLKRETSVVAVYDPLGRAHSSTVVCASTSNRCIMLSCCIERIRLFAVSKE